MDTGLSVDEIYQILEGEIVSLEIKPGEMLSENTLCKRFSISRTPVRSALQRLEQNRFVQIIPHKGTIVTPINLHIANQLIYQRVAVESMVFRDFVKVCTPPEAEQARYHLRLLDRGGQERAGCSGEPSGDDADYRYQEFGRNRTPDDAAFIWGNQTSGREDFLGRVPGVF